MVKCGRVGVSEPPQCEHSPLSIRGPVACSKGILVEGALDELAEHAGDEVACAEDEVVEELSEKVLGARIG